MDVSDGNTKRASFQTITSPSLPSPASPSGQVNGRITITGFWHLEPHRLCGRDRHHGQLPSLGSITLANVANFREMPERLLPLTDLLGDGRDLLRLAIVPAGPDGIEQNGWRVVFEAQP